MKKKNYIITNTFFLIIILIVFSFNLNMVKSNINNSPLNLKGHTFVQFDNFTEFTITSNGPNITSLLTPSFIYFENNGSSEYTCCESYSWDFDSYGNVTDCIFDITVAFGNITDGPSIVSFTLETAFNPLIENYDNYSNIFMSFVMESDQSGVVYKTESWNLDLKECSYFKYYPNSSPFSDQISFHLIKDERRVYSQITDSQNNLLCSVNQKSPFGYVYVNAITLFFNPFAINHLKANFTDLSAQLTIEERDWKSLVRRDITIQVFIGIGIFIATVLFSIFGGKLILDMHDKRKVRKKTLKDAKLYISSTKND